MQGSLRPMLLNIFIAYTVMLAFVFIFCVCAVGEGGKLTFSLKFGVAYHAFCFDLLQLASVGRSYNYINLNSLQRVRDSVEGDQSFFFLQDTNILVKGFFLLKIVL